jgi:hypothetical protein
MLDDVFVSSAELYNNIMMASEMRMAKYVEILEYIVYSAPNSRPSVDLALNEIESILRGGKSNKNQM